MNNLEADAEHQSTAVPAATRPIHPCREKRTPRAASPTIGKMQYPSTLATVANVTSLVTFIKHSNPKNAMHENVE